MTYIKVTMQCSNAIWSVFKFTLRCEIIIVLLIIIIRIIIRIIRIIIHANLLTSTLFYVIDHLLNAKG